jgi:hypothetical protein
MDDGGVGRLLVASLHQGIADELPTRLEFYESWLHPVGLREGRIGLAQLMAVLSFLRTEEGDGYLRVCGRAGQYSAGWLLDEVGAASVRRAAWLPSRLRVWVVMRLARRLVRQTYGGSRAVVRGLPWGRGDVDLRGSVFCQVRDRTNEPLCHFYAAAVRELIARFDLQVDATTTACRAMGAERCRIALLAAPQGR